MESRTPAEVAKDLTDLEESFRLMGLSPEAARFAAWGRNGRPSRTAALSESQASGGAVEADLVESFGDLGLSESASKAAARGRR